MSSLTHFPLEPGHKDYSFLDQAVADFKQGLDSILTDSFKTPKLDTSQDEPGVITSSVSSGFLCLVSIVFDTSKLQLVPSIWSHKLWCQAGALLSLCLWPPRSKLTHYFPNHPTAFGFKSSTPPSNITLNPANRKVDQSLSELQTGTSAAAYTTLHTEQLISHLRVAIVDTTSSPPDSEGGVIPVLEVYTLFIKVHDILDNAVSKQVGNSACILAHVFNSALKQHHDIRAS